MARVEKVGSTGENAPGTLKVFPRNTQGKILSKQCSFSVSSHMFYGNSFIHQYFPSSASSIVLWSKTNFLLPYNWWKIYHLHKKKLRNGKITKFCSRNDSALFSALLFRPKVRKNILLKEHNMFFLLWDRKLKQKYE